VTSTFNATFMDHEFAFLIKRWSDDYESSQKLQQEFASLKQQVRNGIAYSAFNVDALFVQYDCLLGQFQTLQRATSNSNQNRSCQNAVNARRPDCESMKQMVNINIHPNSHGHLTSIYVQLDSSTAEIQYLKNENSNLHQALRRHEEQAAGGSQSIAKLNEDLQKLTLENAKLSEQRDCLSQKCERMAHNLENLQLNVKVAHDTNEKLEVQVRASSIVKFLDVILLLFPRQ
jgi:hypothetical protein